MPNNNFQQTAGLKDYYSLKFENILPVLLKLSDMLPRRHTVDNRSNLSCEPFFILGSGRNGSTLLSSMLNQHSCLMVPPENWVLHEMIIKFKLFNFLEWKDLVNILIGLIADVNSNEGWHTDFGKLYHTLHELPKHDRTLRKIIDGIYVKHGHDSNVQFEKWGDKSPVNTIYLKYIFSVYPKSKYVFLLRDGRDVISSMVKTNKRPLNFAIEKWNYSIKQYKWLIRNTEQDNIHELRYEDLVQNPKPMLTELIGFLGYPFEPQTLDHKSSRQYLNVENMSHHKNLESPISSSSIGKWKKRLSKEEINYILPKIESNLIEFGYLKY